MLNSQSFKCFDRLLKTFHSSVVEVDSVLTLLWLHVCSWILKDMLCFISCDDSGCRSAVTSRVFYWNHTWSIDWLSCDWTVKSNTTCKKATLRSAQCVNSRVEVKPPRCHVTRSWLGSTEWDVSTTHLLLPHLCRYFSMLLFLSTPFGPEQ